MPDHTANAAGRYRLLGRLTYQRFRTPKFMMAQEQSEVALADVKRLLDQFAASRAGKPRSDVEKEYGDLLLYLNEGGEATAGSIAGGKFTRLASASVLPNAGKCWTMPVLANGLLYGRGSSGKLVCLDLRP